MVKIDGRDFVLADIPGLIEGAHEGHGLGDRFLGHVERCGALVHLVDATGANAGADYRTIRRELAAYGEGLAEKAEIVALSKVDAVDEATLKKQTERLKRVMRDFGPPLAPGAKRAKPLMLSTATRTGVTEVLRATMAAIEARRASEIGRDQASAGRMGAVDLELGAAVAMRSLVTSNTRSLIRSARRFDRASAPSFETRTIPGFEKGVHWRVSACNLSAPIRGDYAMSVPGNWTLSYDWNSTGTLWVHIHDHRRKPYLDTTAKDIAACGFTSPAFSHSCSTARKTTYSGNLADKSVTGINTTFGGLNGSFYMLESEAAAAKVAAVAPQGRRRERKAHK